MYAPVLYPAHAEKNTLTTEGKLIKRKEEKNASETRIPVLLQVFKRKLSRIEDPQNNRTRSA